MATNNQMYKIAEINIHDAEDPLRAAYMQHSMSSILREVNSDVEIRRVKGSNTIEVYIPHQHIESHIQPILDPLAAKLEEFKERFSRNGAPVELTIYDLIHIIQQDIRDREVYNQRESIRRLQVEAGASKETIESLESRNSRLQGRYEHAESIVDGLREQLSVAENESNASKQYASGLEQEVASLKRDALQVSATPESLADVLLGNEQLYLKAQENMIEEVYNQISAEIDKREFYQKIGDVEEARKTIEQRDKYLAEHGQEALELLPQASRELAQKEWKDAESLIAEYEQYRAGITPLDFPIRIAKTNEGVTIVIPVNPKSNNEVARTLYDNLVTYSAELQSESGLESSVDGKQPFATLNISGEAGNIDIEDKLLSIFGKVADQAKLNLQPLPTSYFINAPEKGSPASWEVNPADYIRSRITQLGYPSLQRFSDEKSVKGLRTLLYKLSHGAGLADKTIQRLATALEIDSSDLETVLNNYSGSTPEIESPAPAEVNTAPIQVNPADYLKSRVEEEFGSQKEFQDETGIRISSHLYRLRTGHELTDKTIKVIAKNFKGLRWDTLRRNLRQ